ncbi:unnamed protein product [Schistosoma turkestanicum]|nr:unnamed protein product [Schistosoma turkestanicum]
MDPAFITRLNNIAEKYNYEFRDCDIVDLTEFSVTKTGDFLASLPDSMLPDDENDCDVENIQPSITGTGSSTNTTITSIFTDTEKEEKEGTKEEVGIESPLVNENSKMDFKSVKAALSSLERSVSSWEERRFRPVNMSNSYMSNSSSSSRMSCTSAFRNHSRDTIPCMKSRSIHRVKRISHVDKWKSPVQISASKQRVIEWLKHQESFMSQFIL